MRQTFSAEVNAGHGGVDAGDKLIPGTLSCMSGLLRDLTVWPRVDHDHARRLRPRGLTSEYLMPSIAQCSNNAPLPITMPQHRQQAAAADVERRQGFSQQIHQPLSAPPPSRHGRPVRHAPVAIRTPVADWRGVLTHKLLFPAHL